MNVDGGSGRRRSREQSSRAAHQNAKRSEDARQGVRRPTPCCRSFTQRDRSDSSVTRCRTLVSISFQWVYRLSDSISDPPKATPRRVAVDEAAVKINGKWSWLYAAIDPDTKVILDVALFKRHGTDPAAAFLTGFVRNTTVQRPFF
ncbi:transposase [Haloferax mediterranei ATCC 33500]|uniref:Transposase n=1 Tax=Haloferax mediterranei (strain ATCC 33500 / DSM 1411 / JCM 8866 / NBRC 14739 / NCIMB 2177 / R-4) TaxID=523841 RepID=M0JAH6_HALMT|nr:transposase [Haloferax mediterranei ATCC 33500]